MSVFADQILKYTQNITCDTYFQSCDFRKEVRLVFDSYFNNDTCKDSRVYNCILETNIMPKVCCNIVFSYLPNSFQMLFHPPKLIRESPDKYDVEVILPHQLIYGTIFFSDMCIIIDENTYKFALQINMIAESNHKSYISMQRDIDFFSLALYVFKTVEYTNDHDVLLRNINDALSKKYMCIVSNLQIFLKIICSVMLIRKHIPLYKAKTKVNDKKCNIM